jgi:hypothetical protein
MNGGHEERIRARAYELWEQDGRSGDPQEHWLRAERECAVAPNGDATGAPPDEADKMAEQVQVAIDARKARSKQTGRAGSTGAKKPRPAEAKPADARAAQPKSAQAKSA